MVSGQVLDPGAVVWEDLQPHSTLHLWGIFGYRHGRVHHLIFCICTLPACPEVLPAFASFCAGGLPRFPFHALSHDTYHLCHLLNPSRVYRSHVIVHLYELIYRLH